MPQVISRHVLSASAADAVLNSSGGLLSPRSDIILEKADGEGTFSAAEGPVTQYRRTVTTRHIGDAQVE
ncbi:MAG: hypothetical protein OXF21_05135, partial [bacterium]|nr:hypothetical protein [bacterium]